MELLTQNFDKIISVGMIISLSLYFRFLLQILGQTWVMTVSQTSTLILLPIFTYVITKVISNNIALSLGMIGALSIVRFRNPVRSPFELSVYFGVITMGISVAVSVQWALLLAGSVTIVAISLYLLNYFSTKLLSKPFFIFSFSEPGDASTLTVTSSKLIGSLESNDMLISKITTKDNFSYTFSSFDFNRLMALEHTLSEEKSIISLQLSK